ncbi:SRPBCC domain-containing protein [Nocardia sp. NPDC049707]|uniref:SRPBCC domain-containing protein n=1 Tax=Nocardia sp. NPDC049707 TaxID=3154735 RepID=UPI003441AFA0
MSTSDPLAELSFTVSGRIARPCAQVYEAVADPAQLSRYFATGGARGRLAPGVEVTWAFSDFPGTTAVTVLEADPPTRLIIEWEGEAATDRAGTTRVVFEFESIDADARTLVTITETSWQATPAGARAAFGNCEGWTGMLTALKAWVEHGINLREGFYR